MGINPRNLHFFVCEKIVTLLIAAEKSVRVPSSSELADQIFRALLKLILNSLRQRGEFKNFCGPMAYTLLRNDHRIQVCLEKYLDPDFDAQALRKTIVFLERSISMNGEIDLDEYPIDEIVYVAEGFLEKWNFLSTGPCAFLDS